MRILIVEDDEAICRGLRLALKNLGWTFDVATSVSQAWAALRTEPFAVVLLDLGLPDGDGSEVIRRLRSSPAKGLPLLTTPVLIMSARDAISSRIEGLDLGADDFLTKPFSTDELAARVRALRRRAMGRHQALLYWRDAEIDPATRRVRQAGREVYLSAREFGIWMALLEARPHVLSKQQLEGSLYSWDNALKSNAIEVHVHNIRKKLGEECIRTMRGVGYFVPDEAIE
ncbi:response regulator [Acidovorax sp. GBBC 1281]|uniref:response regulator transcription factor n=1 Tax=unclassified Acidovorax TaxID=2684926 RepID=UPI00234B4833|nr:MULTISPECIES: response regulator [unclassified Acidovorax]WCM96623.1 response regulator [Acidovorax sp. GBBC 1281]